MTGIEAAIPYLIAAGAATAAVGAVVSSNNAAASARASAQAQDYNAAVADNQATAARRAASAKEDAFRQNSAQFLGKQRAAAAQSGFDSGSGSMALMLEQSADSAELDALMIRHQGELEANGYNTQATLDRYSAAASRANARRAMSSGYIGAASSLLSGASSYGASSLRIGGANPPTGGSNFGGGY